MQRGSISMGNKSLSVAKAVFRGDFASAPDLPAAIRARWPNIPEAELQHGIAIARASDAIAASDEPQKLLMRYALVAALTRTAEKVKASRARHGVT